MHGSAADKQTNEQPAPIRSRERRRRRAIAAAYQVFREKGHEQSGLQEIADVAEFSVPTLYQHFGSKRQLLGAVVDSCLEELGACIEGQGYPQSSDAAETLIERQLQVQLTLIDVLSPKLWMDLMARSGWTTTSSSNGTPMTRAGTSRSMAGRLPTRRSGRSGLVSSSSWVPSNSPTSKRARCASKNAVFISSGFSC